MSNKLDWATTQSQLTSALDAASDPGIGIAQGLLSALDAAGNAYDQRYAATGVDAAKGAWLVAVQIVWNQADHAAQYVESLSGAPGPALSFNPYDASIELARLSAATNRLPPGSILTSFISIYATALSAAFAAQGGSVALYTDTVTTFLPRPIGGFGYRDSKGVIHPTPAEEEAAEAATRIVTTPSVRSLELTVKQAIDNATAWLALFNS
jgi:hypothetical protein